MLYVIFYILHVQLYAIFCIYIYVVFIHTTCMLYIVVIMHHSERLTQLMSCVNSLPPCNKELLSWMIVHMNHVIGKVRVNSTFSVNYKPLPPHLLPSSTALPSMHLISSCSYSSRSSYSSSLLLHPLFSPPPLIPLLFLHPSTSSFPLLLTPTILLYYCLILLVSWRSVSRSLYHFVTV